MAKMGRPKKKAEDLVKNQLIAIDEETYRALKQICIDTNITLKEVVRQMVADKVVNT